MKGYVVCHACEYTGYEESQNKRTLGNHEVPGWPECPKCGDDRISVFTDKNAYERVKNEKFFAHFTK